MLGHDLEGLFGKTGVQLTVSQMVSDMIASGRLHF